MVLTRRDGSHSYAPPFKLSGHTFEETREAPRQGENSAEILREAGCDDSTIAGLVAAGIVRTS